MMAYTGIITIATAAVSIAIAGVSGVNTVAKFTSPPAIEGVGVYMKPVIAGETVIIDWTITKRVDCPGELSRVWAGDNGFYMVEPQRKSGLPTTDAPREYHIQTKVPELAPAGNLLLSIKGVYTCERGSIPFELGPVSLEVVE